MPLDGIFLSQLTNEVAHTVVGGRVDKIHQPARESIVISMRTRSGGCKLLLSASASNPRLHFTDQPQDNPPSPPMFCMLLRKHLGSARLSAVRQLGLDRVVHLEFETINELGDNVTVTLAVEIMGRHSNIILIGRNGKIIDSIKRVNEEMSRVRPVLPGMTYEPVKAPVRLNIFAATPAQVLDKLRTMPTLELSKALLKTLEGMSPLNCREIAHRATRGVEVAVSQLTEEQVIRLKLTLASLSDLLVGGQAKPFMLVDAAGKPKDFTFWDTEQYGHALVSRQYDTFSGLLDYFYAERDRLDRMHQRGADLLKLIINLSERTARKLTAQREELAASKEREDLRIYADLLQSNLHALQKGMDSVVLENYYEEGMPQVKIALDPRLTPAQNAQHYYARYRKADTAERKLREMIAQGEAELTYFDTVFDELARATQDSELQAIRDELATQGYLRAQTRHGNKPQKLSPLRYRSDDGFLILCGRNNTQNERLTLRESRNSDYWLHTQKIPGSHVIICTEGQQPPDRTLEQAAVIAAYHSKARDSQKVPVDYTQVRNVKKHPANKPGLVIYEAFHTAIVTPDETLVKRLEWNGHEGR